MTRTAVFGPNGMLGKHVMRALGSDAVPIHRRMFTLLDVNSISHMLDELDVDRVINCAGIIPVRNSDVLEMIRVNSEFPHILVRAAGLRPVTLVSTDCVFSGRNRFRYTLDCIKDPRDYYGMSKSLGEVIAPNAMVVRTSFIGCDHGIMHMVLTAGKAAHGMDTPVTVAGWKNALWNGSTVQAVAQALTTGLEFKPGLVHLATQNTTTKYDLVCKLVELNGFNIEVRPEYYPTFNRALAPTVVLQDVYEALAEYKCVGKLAA